MYWTINTPLSQEETVSRLLSITDTANKTFRDSNKLFSGTFKGNNFKIRLIRNYRAPFIPFVYGKILPAKAAGFTSRVLLTISPTTIQIIIPILLFCFSLSILNTHSSLGLAGSSDYLFFLGFILIMLVSGIAIFRAEANKIAGIITNNLNAV